jgi:hypothetical protein
MNKKQLLKLKKAIRYEGLPEQKRILKSIIKGYHLIPHDQKTNYIKTVYQTFNKEK